jgi:microcystin-dependent protein
MGLEAAEFITGLNTNWPTGTDYIREGDDHFRMFKRVVKNSFPNIDDAVTPTPAQLNALGDLTGTISQIITELKLHINKKGTILMWDYANNPSLPTGWFLCNGQTVGGYGVVPNMVDKFVVGSGNIYTNGETGGSLVTGDDGGHTPVIQGHTLTVPEMPSHSHAPLTLTGSTNDNGDVGTLVLTTGIDEYGTTVIKNSTTAAAGGGTAHTHLADDVADHTHTILPPYYATVFIVKCTDYVDPT